MFKVNKISEVKPKRYQTETEKIIRRKMRDLPTDQQRALKQCAKHTGGGFGVLAGPQDAMKLAKLAIANILENLTDEEQAAMEDEMALSMYYNTGPVRN